ncbi:unnamed protein product, partial [marine sediment metagenome]
MNSLAYWCPKCHYVAEGVELWWIHIRRPCAIESQ